MYVSIGDELIEIDCVLTDLELEIVADKIACEQERLKCTTS